MNLSQQNRAGASAAEPREVPRRKIRPLRSLRTHATVVVLVMVAVVVAGFPIAWKKGKRTYAAQAVIFVSPRFLKNLDDDKEFELQSNSQYREFVQQNVRTIDRYDLVEEALKRLSKQGHPWRRRGESLEQAVIRLEGELKIMPVPDTYQITVRIESEKPDGLAETVNMLVAVFLEKSKEEDFYGRDQRVASLQKEAQDLRSEIDSLARDKDKIAQELAVSVFSESFSNPFDQLLVGSKQALAAARQKHIVSEAQLASLEHSPSPDSRTGLQADASEVARRDPDIASLESNLNFRRNELLAKLGGMLPTHPGRLEIEAELRQVDEVARVKREDLESTYASIILAQRQAEAAANARAERDIQKQVDEQAAQAIWYSHNYQRGINIRYEMDRSRRRLEAVEDRISFVEQEGRAPGFARLFSAARYPIEPLSGGRKKPILILFLLAAVLALAVPLGLDYLDPRVLSPDDVETVLGFAPMGVALASTADLAGNDHMRRLAAAIARDFERNASRSFVFVPVNGSARMSETVLGIGSELAGLGHTVEVVGAGIQQPLVQAAATGHGVGGSGNHSVPRSDSFGAMRSRMHDLAQRGAIVLVCAEPLSEDAETELLASSCDVVVLAIESVLTKKTELRAAIRRLEDIRPNAIAAVVTEYDPNPPLAELKLGTYICAAWLAGSRGQAAGGKNS